MGKNNDIYCTKHYTQLINNWWSSWHTQRIIEFIKLNNADYFGDVTKCNILLYKHEAAYIYIYLIIPDHGGKNKTLLIQKRQMVVDLQ